MKPDFTGTWIFNPVKSSLQISPPDATVFVIDHQEPNFRISRTHVFQGKSDTLALEFTTDGTEIAGQHGPIHFRGNVTWDGDALVFVSHVSQGISAGTNTVRYTLSDDSNVLLAQEQLRSTGLNYDNRWVLDRAVPKTPE